MRAWFAALIAGLSGGAAHAAPQRADYAAGQVWRYHARPQDVGSLLKIQRIDAGPAGGRGLIYHISIIGVHIGPGGVIGEIAHTPVSRETLDGSVTDLVDTDTKFPDAAPGIAEWRAANGGVFTITVAEIVAAIDQTASSR